MRTTRIVAVVTATLMSLAMVFTMESAIAQVHPTAKAASFGTFDVRIIAGGNALRAHGNTVGWERKPILIQRARRGTGHWTTIARTRTDGAGRFAARLTKRDIPCNGVRYRIRAKKGHTGSTKLDGSVWHCS